MSSFLNSLSASHNHLIMVYNALLSIRYQSRCSNLGRIMESHCPRLLGALYKDPITSFREFQKFSVQHPEASPSLSAILIPTYRIWFSVFISTYLHKHFRNTGPLF